MLPILHYWPTDGSNRGHWMIQVTDMNFDWTPAVKDKKDLGLRENGADNRSRESDSNPRLGYSRFRGGQMPLSSHRGAIPGFFK